MLGETYRIINCTNNSEYQDLSTNHKEWYQIFISAGMLDLSEGSFARTKLWNMFPEGTITGDAIRNPANGLVITPNRPNPE